MFLCLLNNDLHVCMNKYIPNLESDVNTAHKVDANGKAKGDEGEYVDWSQSIFIVALG